VVHFGIIHLKQAGDNSLRIAMKWSTIPGLSSIIAGIGITIGLVFLAFSLPDHSQGQLHQFTAAA